jgi:hypothetical protein
MFRHPTAAAGQPPSPGRRPEKFNGRLVAPPVFRKKPFGKDAEGLAHHGDRSYESTRVFNF